MNIPLRRDAPALPEGEPFYRERLQPKASHSGRGGCRKADGEGFPKETGVAAERQTERVFEGNRVDAKGGRRGFSKETGWTPKADVEGANIKLTFSNEQ